MRNLTWLTIALAFTAALNGAAVGGEGWPTDWDAARQAAAERNVPILADFSGSDWCGWCMKLDKEVFSTDEFKAFAKDNLVLFVADFPARKKQPEELASRNGELAEQYGVRNFPTVLLIDAKGAVLARTGYQAGGAAAYVEHLKKLLADAKK